MGTFIQSSIRDGSLVLYHDYRSGSFQDFSGNGNDGTPISDPHWNGDSLMFAASSWVQVTDSVELQLTALTIVCLGKFTETLDSTVLVSKRDVGGSNYLYGLNAGVFKFYDGINTRTLVTDITGHAYVGITVATGEIAEGFVDGLSVGAYNDTSTITTDDAAIYIGNFYAGTQPYPDPIEAVLIFNKKITDAEHLTLYRELI